MGLRLRTSSGSRSAKGLGDVTWADVRKAYDERTAIELLLLIGHYDMLATTLMTLRIEPDATR